ncbi:hypothetical protein [Escherichia phage FL20]
MLTYRIQHCIIHTHQTKGESKMCNENSKVLAIANKVGYWNAGMIWRN